MRFSFILSRKRESHEILFWQIDKSWFENFNTIERNLNCYIRQ